MSDFSLLRQYRVVPVVAVDTVTDGLHLCEALLAGGLPIAEITFRTNAAAETIRAASQQFPEMCLGAGTVLTPEQAVRARDAGAKFAMAPGCNPTVIKVARQIALPFVPGICTPSDIENAFENGCQTLKFFPAEAAGGVAMLKAMSAPYKHLGINFCPTGGVTASNLPDYLAVPTVAFAGGTWIANQQHIKEKNWRQIELLAAEAKNIAAAQ